MPICPRCNKRRQPREKIVSKRGKEWLIEFCRVCNYNFDITEWNKNGKVLSVEEEDANDKPKRKAGWFKA